MISVAKSVPDFSRQTSSLLSSHSFPRMKPGSYKSTIFVNCLAEAFRQLPTFARVVRVRAIPQEFPFPFALLKKSFKRHRFRTFVTLTLTTCTKTFNFTRVETAAIIRFFNVRTCQILIASAAKPIARRGSGNLLQLFV